MAGFSKMFASEVLTNGPPVDTALNVYNLDKWDHDQNCNTLPQLPNNYIPINAEFLHRTIVVCGVDNPNNALLSKCYCHKLVKGVWVSMPTPPTSVCLVGAATSTLTLKSMLGLFLTLVFLELTNYWSP